MPLYGYKKDATTTIVGAALNKQEFNEFYEAATELYSDRYKSDMMMHLTDPEIQGFQAEVAIFEHADSAQQDAFITKHDILIGTRQRAVDRNADMVNYDAPDPWLNVDDERTIEQIHGLDKEDRWDKRTDEERDADRQMKKMMDDLKKKGELSNDDSFSPRKDEPKEGDVRVTDIRTTAHADGSVTVDNVLAVKLDEETTNAVLDVQFGDRSVRTDVSWDGRDIHGADSIRDDLYFGDKYRDEWNAENEPIITITSRDGKQKSGVKFVEMLGEMVADTPFKVD
jgi:hypothetical protein